MGFSSSSRQEGKLLNTEHVPSETNCSSFAVNITRVRAGRRMSPLENITLWINRGIEMPGRRREQASKKWLLSKIIWYT